MHEFQQIWLRSDAPSPLSVGGPAGKPVTPDAPELGLSAELRAELGAWVAAFPAGLPRSSEPMRRHLRAGRRVARRLAGELGPGWLVRCHDHVHDCWQLVCWQCDAFHWRVTPHEPPEGSRTVEVCAEYGFWPLRFDGDPRRDFAPDDAWFALPIGDALVDGLYGWAAGVRRHVDALIGVHGAEAAPTREELVTQGARLATALAGELGPGWTVGYGGVAH